MQGILDAELARCNITWPNSCDSGSYVVRHHYRDVPIHDTILIYGEGLG